MLYFLGKSWNKKQKTLVSNATAMFLQNLTHFRNNQIINF